MRITTLIIRSSAPSRLSLFGGGTDIPSYYEENDGFVINIAINLRAHFTLYTGDDIFAMKGEDIVPLRGKKPFIHAFLREYGHRSWHDSKYESDFDGLLESGLGSSAASAVAILGALNKERDLRMDQYQIANRAWDIEVNNLGLFGGKQDQIASSFGGMNTIEFTKDNISVTQLDKEVAQRLVPNLVLFHTGQFRKSPTIQEGFKAPIERQIKSLDQIKYVAQGALDPIIRGDLKTVGRLLNDAWELKKQSNWGVSNKDLDFIYYQGIKNGALGGKLCGSGGGGYMFFLITEKMDKMTFVHKMEKFDLEWTDFDLDAQGVTARIL